MACSSIPKGPIAPQIPYEHKLHGDTRVDKYFWMNQRDSKPVLDYLKAENDYTAEVLKDTEKLQEDLFKEMKARIKEDESSAPYKYKDYYYYTRYEQGKEYPIYCRKKGVLTAVEEIILNVNELAEGEKYFDVGHLVISPDQKTLAFAQDNVGRRFFTIRFKDLGTGFFSTEKIEGTTGDFVWAQDNKTIFYVYKNPETLRSEKVFRYSTEDQKSDEIFYEKDEIFSVGLDKSLNEKFIFIRTSSFDSSENWYIPALEPQSKWKLFLSREPKHEYSIEDGNDGFYIKTNWNAKNFRLMKVDYQNSVKTKWKEVIPHRTETYLESFMLFESHLVLEERFQGLTQLNIIERTSGKNVYVKFPEPTYSVGLHVNAESSTDKVRYVYSSMIRSSSVFEYDFKLNTSQLVKTTEVPTYDSEKYKSERIWAKANDGTLIPISVVYRVDKFSKSQNPIIIYGYGSYSLSMDPYLNRSMVSLLDRGFVYALAHIRGGSEMGRDWYEQGRMNQKMNTFTDFIACSESLVAQGYGAKNSVYAMGGSAGGLLVGAVMNLRPDLYRGVLASVPFVDVLTTMLDPNIPLTTAEYEQWGNPNESGSYFYIKAYSPYDNVEKKSYPHIYVDTGYHDSQVQYWEPAKWVAKLRELKTDNHYLLLKTNMDAGHGGASGRFEALKETATEFAFILKVQNHTSP